MWQQLVVGVVVACAVAYSAWALLPARRKLRLLLAVDGWAARRPTFAAWRARLLAPRIQRAAGSGCAGCSANMDPPAARRR